MNGQYDENGIMALLGLRQPDSALYKNYEPAEQLKQGLLTPAPEPQGQSQSTNQTAQQILQAADMASQQMAQKQQQDEQ